MQKVLISIIMILLCSSAYAKVYIVNSENEVTAKCSYVPNVKDLESRGEIMVLSDLDIDLADAEYRGGKIQLHKQTQKEIKEIKATEKMIRNKIERSEKIKERAYKIAELQLIDEGILKEE